MSQMKRFPITAFSAFLAFLLISCQRTPDLHLHWGHNIKTDFVMVQLDLEVYWNYDVHYDWQPVWTYGWDDEDRRIFCNHPGYTKPDDFLLYRYGLGLTPDTHHAKPSIFEFSGTSFSTHYDVGYYDMLVRNELGYLEQQALYFREEGDSIIAYTSPDDMPSRYDAPGFTRAYSQPEELFAAYTHNIHISDNPDDYDKYDPDTKTYYKNMGLDVHPVTYIYLTQIRLHNNDGKIDRILGKANLNGMANSVCLNSGIAGNEHATVGYFVRMKRDCRMPDTGEKVDIIGGRCLTFGIPNQNSSRITRASDVNKDGRQYLDLDVTFYNGMDSTLVFDVTKQVHEMYRGGVITIDLDMDTIPAPSRPGGSGFDAVVKDFNSEDHFIDI